MPNTYATGLRLQYDDAGRGEPALLCLPGWCGSRAVFGPLVSRCSHHRRTLAVDWRGRGGSEVTSADFGSGDLVDDALAVIGASGVHQVIPVALAHAGWVAIELRRRLGDRVPKLVLLDWIITEPPPPFVEVLNGLQSPERWLQTRETLFAMWLTGVSSASVTAYVRDDMATYGFDMWARAAREISAAYAQAGSPLAALAALDPPASVLHLFAQPDDPAYLAAQERFTGAHPWFTARKLEAHSHFPILEVPDPVAAAIERFAG